MPAGEGGGGRGSGLKQVAARVTRIENLNLIALVVAGGYAVFELTLNRIDRHVDAAMTLAQRFNEGELGAARRTLDGLWYARADEVSRLQSAGPASAVVQEYVQRVIVPGNDEVSERDVRRAISMIADNLDQVAICAKPPCGLWPCDHFAQCDPETTNRHFCDYAQSFHALYAPTIEEIRGTFGNGGLGEALARYVTEGDCAQ